MRRVAPLLLLIAPLACKRPVTGADSGETLVFDLEVDPQFIRADVPIDLRYRVSGKLPEKVTYDIGGQQFDCTPEVAGDGRFVCTHPGITRDAFSQGTTLAVLEATDADGRTSIATAQVTIDYDCPAFASLVVTPPIAQPGDTVVLTIETTERLRDPPLVTRGGISWETPVGQASSYSVTHEVSVSDPASISDVVVRIVDLAGNTSLDCGIDGRISFGVDHANPGVDPQKILIRRPEPGVAATLTASTGAFFDDVQVAEVRVIDAGGQLVASLRPNDDGSIPATNLGGTTGSRVLVEAVDLLGQTSPRVTVPEQWRLSVGAGATPNAALRTAVRLTPPPANTDQMSNRTATFAPNVREADARRASVRAHVGFQQVGRLPNRYEDANSIVHGYDPVGKSILAVGGASGQEYNFFDTYMSDVLVIRWDEDESAYVAEAGPSLSLDDPDLPNPRVGEKIAFDGRGCGVIHGGYTLAYRTDVPDQRTLVFSSGTFQLCRDEQTGAYAWNKIEPVTEPGDVVSGRNAPITWDPLNERYVIVGDVGQGANDRVRFLVPPDQGQLDWQLINVTPLPTNFNFRSLHFLFFDPRLGGFTVGSGNVAPIGNGEQSLIWTYQNGQWQANSLPFYMVYRARFGSDFDQARRQLVVWGGNNTGYDVFADEWTEPQEEVYLMTQTATNGEAAWRVAEVDAPVGRYYPSVVYDSSREVTVMFGGVRLNDERWIPPDIHELVAEPSYPYLQAAIDLDTPRPKGIERLELSIGAAGTGDGDGTGPNERTAEGVVVMLWDSGTRTWVEVGGTQAPGGVVEISVTDNPERFVLPTGVVPVTIRSRWPATEALDARLDVDVIDGALHLREGVTLP